MTFSRAAAAVHDGLGLTHPAIGIAFADAPPAGVDRVERAEAAGCGYWRLAQEGRTFYTEPVDHGNCAVGAHTHHVEMDAAKSAELQQLVGTMVGLGYLDAAEIPHIPRLTTPLRYAVYGPLRTLTVRPDVVLLRGNVRQIMIAQEAARAAGCASDGAAMGRPACALVPAAKTSSCGTASLGCIGNRVYTGLGDGEMYFAVPGAKLDAFIDKLDVLAHANRELEAFHGARQAAVN